MHSHCSLALAALSLWWATKATATVGVGSLEWNLGSCGGACTATNPVDRETWNPTLRDGTVVPVGTRDTHHPIVLRPATSTSISHLHPPSSPSPPALNTHGTNLSHLQHSLAEVLLPIGASESSS